MKATEYYWLRPSGLSASYKFFISLLHISHSPVHKRLLEFTQKKFSPREWKLLCNYMNDKYGNHEPKNNFYPEKDFLDFFVMDAKLFYEENIKKTDLDDISKKRLAAAHNFLLELKKLEQQ